ncbi:MAG: hypothetical protein HY854_10525 [Burkholderiales bacterium]|nr:hypothetical protein [Burkholderiales bacterium]
MKNLFLKPVAAAVLLIVPMSAALVAAPATAQTRGYVVAQAPAPGFAAAAPQIERFVMRQPQRMEAGRDLRFRIEGAPGADAWLDIPGVVRNVDLAEVRPGVYEGHYTIRVRDDLDAFDRAVATLQRNGLRTTARVEMRAERDWDDRGWRDARGPRITDITPSHGDRVNERGRTEISARIHDNRSGVDRRSIRLRVDGRDVTRAARIDNDSVVYRDDLREGRHTAELVVRDRRGNETRRSWSFDVVDRHERIGQPPPPPMTLAVTSHAPNAYIDFRGNLRLEGATLPHATVRVQVDSVANVGGVIGVNQPVADQVVQADASGRFAVVISPRVVPIPGARYDVRLTASEGGHQVEQRLSLHQRG